MGKIQKFLVLFIIIVIFSGCKKRFQDIATERFEFVIDSLNKENIKEDQIAISHKGKPDEARFKKETLICSNDTAFIQTFNLHWIMYTGEPADKLCFFAICKNREGKVYELFKPVAWLEKVQMDSYVSKLNEKKALIDAIYKACLIAGEEKQI